MTASATGQVRAAFGRLRTVSRSGEWWEYKLVPIFAIFYATALRTGVSLWTLWPAALILVGALVPGAVYVSILNDLTDQDEDAAAGKHNRMAGRPSWQKAFLLILPLGAGTAFAISWRHDLPLLLVYLSAWTAYSLYSIPPIRLKTRGFAGVVADACGAHLFPALTAMLLVFHQAGLERDAAWTAAVSLWSLAYGVRGIFWHQLLDIDNDRAAGVGTFACRSNPARLIRLARYAVFPAEVAGLAGILCLSRTLLPALFLLGYLVLVHRRVARWAMHAVLVQPQPRYFIILADYYDVLLPSALLIASAMAHPLDLSVLVIHILLFPNRLRMVAEDVWRLRHSFSRIVPSDA
jgi:hypothetical protein